MYVASSTRRYTCATCARSFVKAEHLTRHERSHKGDKPHVCECGSRFTRPDSLSRHFKRSGHSGRHLDHPNAEQTPIQSDEWTWDGDEIVAEPVLDPRVDFNPDPSTLGMLSEEFLTDDPFQQLTWPDSQDLLQSILNNHIEPLPDNPESCPPAPLLTGRAGDVRSGMSLWLPQNEHGTNREDNEAVRNVSQIIVNVSSNVTSEAESASLSPVFLDECLHLFFDQFIPTFPVVHRPTFEYREWTHPLLLNAIAIGSLFLGEERHIAQGEALWKLAHVAVATSWHALIQHQAPSDNCRGVQLVATALLGQTYAMLSRNRKLRMTAQMFHSLGFYWAHECGMYAAKHTFDISTNLGCSDDQLLQEWRKWAGEEVQLRVVLGHFILDCQLARFLSAPSSQRHASNSLPLPCSDRLFKASTPKDWVEAHSLEDAPVRTFRELVLDLYSVPSEASKLPPTLSPLAIKVLLECLCSVILESRSAGGPVLGAPTPDATALALKALYIYIRDGHHLPGGYRTEILLRWHNVCIESVTDTVSLCRELCSQHKIDQNVFPSRKEGERSIWPKTWASSPKARVAVLHASAIYEQLDSLPFSHSHAIHLAMSIFAAAMVYCAHVFSGVSTIALPNEIDWTHVMSLSGVEVSQGGRGFASSRTRDSPVGQFVMGQASPSNTRPRNLLYELNVLMLRLRQLGQPWGIALELEAILRALLSSRGALKQAGG